MHSTTEPPPQPLSPRHHAPRQLAALVVTVCAILIALTGWHIHAGYEHQREQNVTDVHNLSTVLLRHAELAITHSSTILHGAIERLQNDGDGLISLGRLLQVARAQADAYPEIQDVLIFDREGDWIVSTRNPQPNSTYADRGYFQYHQYNRNSEIYIGPPIESRVSGDWVITVSRRTEDKQGNFTGVVVVTLSVQAFLDHYHSIELGRNGIIDIIRSDGALLVRSPFTEPDSREEPLLKPIYHAIQQGNHQGELSYTSPVDDIRRLVGYRVSETLPIHILVGLDEGQAFAQWRRESGDMVLLLISALGLIALLAHKTISSITERQRAEADLRQAYRALSETNQSLEALASEDALTGLANRRQFDLVLDHLFSRSALNHEPLSLILVDIDNFKNYNDTFGHQAGDRCLRQVGDCLRQQLHRSADIAARYGGEEMAVILPNTDLAGAFVVADKIRQAVYDANLPNPQALYGRVTLSIGVASCIPSADYPSPSMLIEEADAALYRAKHDGKNCTMTQEALPA